MQAFKENDAKEAKVTSCFLPWLTLLGNERDLFYAGAYTAYPLGNALYDLDADPLSGVIGRETFVQSFPAIHSLFASPGPFEFYLEVFRAIWGEDVDVEFTIPAPGKLEIAIEALDATDYLGIVREIIEDEYEYFELIDQDGDNIVFQGSQGIKTQREVDALMKEIAPQGVWIETTLTLT